MAAWLLRKLLIEIICHPASRTIALTDKLAVAKLLEIKSEIEKVYGVEVEWINTMVTAPKSKRNRRTGQTTGRTNIYKKAICKLKEGQTIDFYENI